MRKLHKLIPAVALALASSKAHAFLAYDGFDYPVGNLVENTAGVYTGRTNPFGPTWAACGTSTTDNVSITTPGLTAPAWLGGVGNTAEWAGPTAGANAARMEIGPFSGPAVGGFQQTKYYSLAMNITDITVLNPGTSIQGNILAGFNTVSGAQTGSPGVIGTRFLARQHPSDATMYQLGMSKNSGTLADVVWDPRQWAVGATHFIVGSYTLIGTGADANDISELWIDPASGTFGGAAPTADITTASGNDLSTNRIESFLLRQSGPAGTGATNIGIQMDELRIGNSWADVAPGQPNERTGGSGAWSDGTKWSLASAPNAAGAVARFPTSGSPVTVTMDAAHTAGQLYFNSPNSYTINGGNTLTISGSSMVVVDGDHTITAPVSTTGDLTITVATGKSLTLGSLTMPGTATLWKSGYGTTTVNNVRTQRLEHLGGKIKIAPNSLAAGVSVVNTLDLPIFTDVARPTGYVFDAGPRGTLDLTNNKLIVQQGAIGTWNGTTYTDVQGLVRHGYNGGGWDGTGIATSEPDALISKTTIGVATGAQAKGLGPTDTDLWAGQTINGNSVLVMYTYAGDANLDGTINPDDYALIGFNDNIAGAAGYYNGDFNYDGDINADDFALIDFNFNAQGAPFFTSGGVNATAVPEPAACGLLGVCAALLARRRRVG